MRVATHTKGEKNDTKGIELQKYRSRCLIARIRPRGNSLHEVVQRVAGENADEREGL